MGFRLKNIFTSCSLAWKNFISLRFENDEHIYTRKDKNMRWFVRQSIKRSRCTAFNQYFKFKIADIFLKTISEEVNVKGNICEVIEAYDKYMSKEKKQ